MDVNEVYTCAAGLLGELTDAEQAVLRQYCDAAMVQCRARLRGDADETASAAILEQACAMLAAGMLLDAGETGEVQSFTAGKLSVTTRSGTGDRAARLKSCAESLLAPYTAGGFAFLGVRG